LDAQSLNVGIAFGAGALSFLSPCVVPLVPAYLTYVTNARTGQVIPGAVAFMLGLSAVLSLFGLGVTALGQALGEYQTWMTRLAGAIVIVLGLHTAGLLRIPALQRETRLDASRLRGGGPLSAFLMGGAFGVGWTPCVGAILGSILALASQSDTLGHGTTLLFAYSLGLGVPFILVALGLDRATGMLRRVKERLRAVELASGALLVLTGVLLFTDRLFLLTSWFTQTFGNGLAL
jgi:cytochrome c-type biogenesis protein